MNNIPTNINARVLSQIVQYARGEGYFFAFSGTGGKIKKKKKTQCLSPIAQVRNIFR